VEKIPITIQNNYIMIHRNYQTEPLHKNPHQIAVNKLYDHASAQVMHMLLKPGEKLKPHKTPVDVFFYVLEGTPTVLIGDATETFEKDTLIESPAFVMHSISNESTCDARILVVKAPRP
jgi:mannose-6-phosphate isomerase-like protein (cupin superfamily)